MPLRTRPPSRCGSIASGPEGWTYEVRDVPFQTPSPHRGREGFRLPSLRTVQADLPHTALQSVVSSSGLARQGVGFGHGEKPPLSEEGIRPAAMVLQGMTQPPFQAYHLPPVTPLTRAANIRSLHTVGSTHPHWRGSRVSCACLAVSGTDALGIAPPSLLKLTDQPSYPPLLPRALPRAPGAIRPSP